MTGIARFVVGACALCVVSATSVAADPVRVTNGFLTSAQTSPGSALAITGTRGFSAVADVIPGEGNVEVFTSCTPCEPGLTIGVGAVLGGSAFGGTVTLDGTSYILNAGVNDVTILDLEITATATTPPLTSGVGFMQTPFTMTGTFFPGAGLTKVPLVGRGLATVLLRSLPFSNNRSGPAAADEPFAWNASFVHYDFENATATPEPATLALVGVGALVAGTRQLRALRSRWSRG